MKYRDFIQDNFEIDDARTGQMVPFVFNKVQNKLYDALINEYGEENNFERAREIILKARREGFTSLILALFAADMILSEHPKTYLEISYKDDATKQHFQRFKGYIESYKRKRGLEIETDNKHEIVLKHNKARFYVGTASAKVGERGGTVHRLLFTEAAHFPDTEIMTADEIINATMRMVDIDSGWVFVESTANGRGNTYERMWQQAESGQSRFRPRFFSWMDFYTPEQFKLIESEFTDKEMVKQEYPANPEEAFLASASNFTTSDQVRKLVGFTNNNKRLIGWLELGGLNYIEQAEIIKAYLLGLEKEYARNYLYVGIDVAKNPDKTIVTVLADRDTTLSNDGARVKCIAIDSTGIGDYMPDWFERNSRWYIHRVKFSAQQKDALYKNLLQVLTNLNTELPSLDTDEGKQFVKELVDLQSERRGDIISVHHPEGNYHDDYPDSWALAEWAFTFINGMPKTREIPQAPVNKIAQLLQRQDRTTSTTRFD